MIFLKKCIFTALSLVFLSAYANSEIPMDAYLQITVPKHVRIMNMIENTHNFKKKLILSVMLEFTLDQMQEQMEQTLNFIDLYGPEMSDEQYIYSQKDIRLCKSVIDEIKVWRQKYCYEIWKD